MQRLVLFSLGCLFTILLIAQTNRFTVKGQLIEEDSQPIPYVTLSVVKTTSPQNIISRLASDDKGRFSLSLEEGNYLLSFHFTGKEVLSKEFSVGETSKPLDLGK